MEILKLAMIYGSVRPDRFCDVIAEWAAGEIERTSSFVLTSIDPREQWPVIDERAVRAGLAQADAFLIVTPEYNHSFPGPLKILIDAARTEWAAKPVGFVSYGGVSGGLRAVEHLRAVFAELHAVTIRESTSFQNPWDSFVRRGHLVDRGHYSRTMATMVSRLGWWARALKAARHADAYGDAA
jgi:NAD(P)H-dependent FMN reductase